MSRAKRIRFTLRLIVALVITEGCSPSQPTTRDLLVGKWQTNRDAINYEMIFNADGSYKYESRTDHPILLTPSATVTSGTWELDGSLIKIKYDVTKSAMFDHEGVNILDQIDLDDLKEELGDQSFTLTITSIDDDTLVLHGDVKDSEDSMWTRQR